MSVYNGEEYLAGAMDSILNQTFTDFEFIIINDGSTDATISILEDYADRDPRIRLIDQENTGLTRALRRGCDAARGAYIARMDADDVSMPDRFEEQIALLNSDSKLVAVTGDVEHFLNTGRVVHTAKLRGDARLIRFYNCFVNYIGGHGQVMFRKDAYHTAGGYDPAFKMAQDYSLWSRLLLIGDFGNVPKVIYRFRTGHDSISSRSKDEQAHHSLRTCLTEYERMTGEALTEGVAMVMRRFWWMVLPGKATRRDTFAASQAMHKVANIFFRDNPDLRHEEYGIYRDIAARWYWRTKEVPPSHLIYRGIFALNFLGWGTRAVWARFRTKVL